MAQVLPAPITHEEQSTFQQTSMLRRSSSQPSLYLDTSDYSLKRGHSSTSDLNASSTMSSDDSPSSLTDSPPESPELPRLHLSRTPSFHSTPPSSVSLDIQYAHTIAEGEDDDDDEDLQLPRFADSSYKRMQSAPPGSPNDHDNFRSSVAEDDEEEESILTEETDPETLLAIPADDTQVKQEPSRQVDYLSHEWREEDIWESWKHIVSRRRYYGERSRLENASWRTWAKQKDNLKTVSPETLNWLKDCDVTWLYGPLQESKQSRQTSEPSSRLSKSSSFVNKKPILKKRSVSEEMLQKSLSSSSLIKQAAAAVQAQRKSYGRSRPGEAPRLRRTVSEVSNCPLPSDPLSYNLTSTRTMSTSTESGLDTPEGGQSRRHIRFDDKVEQCIAVDFKDFTIDEENHPEWTRAVDDSDSEDDNMPTIKTKPRKRSMTSTPDSSRNSFSEPNTGIAKLPSTTLKHEEVPSSFFGLAPSRRPMLSPSPSQETIRPGPSRRTADFSLPNDSDEDDLDWEPSGAFGSLRRDSLASPASADKTQERLAEDAAEEGLAAKGMRRTPSGMFMPLEESEDDDAQSGAGILGRVVDTVNTARDIAYVLYNVGWRR